MPVLTANQAGYSAAAALTMLTWDLLVNLDDEIEYVWRWPKGWLKGMYCFIRYLPLIGETTFFSLIQRFQRREMLASSTCLSIDVAEYFVLQAVAAAVAIISILRVYVLYDRSKWLLLFLAPIFVACAGISVTGIAKYRTAYTFTGSCLTTYEPDFVLIGWTLPVTFELILFLLVFYKFLQNIRSASHLAGQPVLLVFLRDGIAAFLAIFTVTCVTVASSVAFVELSSGFFYWNMTVYSIAGSHVLLNLREVVTRTGYPSTMASSTESNSIEFQMFSGLQGERNSSEWTVGGEVTEAFELMEMGDRQASGSGQTLDVS